jgi:hypothetical protein
MFNLNWLEAWMIEAVATIFGALLLGYVLCKVADFITGDNQ